LIERISIKLGNTLGKVFPRNRIIHEQQSKAAKKSLCPDKLIGFTSFLCEKYHPCAVIGEYVFTAPCLDVVPKGIIKFIDTHDMFSRKVEEVISYGIPDLLHCTFDEERKYLLKCDIIIAVQAQEAEMFKKMVPEREVITVGIDYSVVDDIDQNVSIPGTILVVGSDNALNLHGLKEFYAHSWPLIKRKSQNAVLRIVGKIGNHFQTGDERVEICGWAEDLAEEYRRATVVINPTLAGTGLKIKSVEALCYAKPLVATLKGTDGISFTGDPPFVVCNNWGEFAHSVLELLNSDEKRRDLQMRAMNFAMKHFYSENVYAPLAERLGKLGIAIFE